MKLLLGDLSSVWLGSDQPVIHPFIHLSCWHTVYSPCTLPSCARRPLTGLCKTRTGKLQKTLVLAWITRTVLQGEWGLSTSEDLPHWLHTWTTSHELGAPALGPMSPSTGKTGSKWMLVTAANSPAEEAILSVHLAWYSAPTVHTETKQDAWDPWLMLSLPWGWEAQ